MRVEWDNQLTRLEPSPHAAVDAIGRTRHPTQVEVDPLARASLLRRRKEKAHTDPFLPFPLRVEVLDAKTEKQIREPADSDLRVGVLRLDASNERVLDRSEILQRAAHRPEQRAEIAG